MPDTWSRQWIVNNTYDRWGFYQLTRISDGDTLLRMHLSWHVYGTSPAVSEPLLVGVELRSGATGEITAPPDPAAGFLGLVGEWLAVETHAPVRDPAVAQEGGGAIWPRDGFRIWDIKANRRPQGESIIPFLVWALPQNSRGNVDIRFCESTLVRLPDA